MWTRNYCPLWAEASKWGSIFPATNLILKIKSLIRNLVDSPKLQALLNHRSENYILVFWPRLDNISISYASQLGKSFRVLANFSQTFWWSWANRIIAKPERTIKILCMFSSFIQPGDSFLFYSWVDRLIYISVLQ